jgi:hypothetical protein
VGYLLGTANSSGGTHRSNESGYVRQAKTASQNSAIQKDAYDSIKPFATSRMNGGLPFFDVLTDYTGSTTAAYAPGRSAILRRFDTMSGLPSGMKEQTLADYDANEARGFDQNMINNLVSRAA